MKTCFKDNKNTLKNKSKLTLKLLFSLLIFFSLFDYAKAVENVENAQTAKDVVYIDSEDDFIEFARSCQYDKYSKGLKVVLRADLDFVGKGFESIPIFYGDFDGGSHLIKGISLNEAGSRKGVFRINAGSIRALRVNARFKLSGSADDSGIIVGENRGIIDTCSASGEISADTSIGGIVGVNAEGARVIYCSNYATVNAAVHIGGIAGFNSGLIKNSLNEGEINTAQDQINKNKLFSMRDLKDEFFGDVSTNTIEVFSCAGGICGRNTGAILNSTNKGGVGYKHLGNNVGGICGISNGGIEKSNNFASIQGRKNVGGIVGQFEPDIRIKYSAKDAKGLRRDSEMLVKLFSELNSQLDYSADGAIDKADGINASIKNMESIVKKTATGINEISKEKMDILYESFGEINATTALILDAYEKYSKLILKDSDSAINAIYDIGDEIDFIIENIDENVEGANTDIKASRKNIATQKDRLLKLEENFKNISDKMGEHQADIEGEIASINEANAKLSAIFDELASGGSFMANANELNSAISQIISSSTSLLKMLGDVYKSSSDELKYIESEIFATSKIITDEISNINTTLSASTESVINGNKLALENINSLKKELSDATDGLNKHLNKLNDLMLKYLRVDNEQVGIIKDTLKEEFDYVNANLNSSYDALYKEAMLVNANIDALLEQAEKNGKNINKTTKDIIKEIDDIRLGIDEMLRKPEFSYENIFDELYEQNMLKKGVLNAVRNNGMIMADSYAGGIVGLIGFDSKRNPKVLFEENEDLWRDTKAYLRAVVAAASNSATVASKQDYAAV